MDPVAITVELELGSLIVAAVAAIATFIHHRHQDKHHQQRERHHEEMRAVHERHARGQTDPLRSMHSR